MSDDDHDDVKTVRGSWPYCKRQAQYLLDAQAYDDYMALKR